MLNNHTWPAAAILVETLPFPVRQMGDSYTILGPECQTPKPTHLLTPWNSNKTYRRWTDGNALVCLAVWASCWGRSKDDGATCRLLPDPDPALPVTLCSKNQLCSLCLSFLVSWFPGCGIHPHGVESSSEVCKALRECHRVTTINFSWSCTWGRSLSPLPLERPRKAFHKLNPTWVPELSSDWAT